jgi:hypothetical protein
VTEIAASHSVDLTPPEAAAWIDEELAQAHQDLAGGDVDAALDSHVRALGLALQLGPAPTEQVLVAVLETARTLALDGNTRGLSALGPTLVKLVDQVRAAGVLPPTAVMEAWAAVSAEIGALIGQIGLALSLPPDRRSGMLDNARVRAAHLDDATRHLLGLGPWLAGIESGG